MDENGQETKKTIDDTSNEESHSVSNNSQAPTGNPTLLSNRNLDHLAYCENLYDFMKSLIPFSITTSNKSINNYLLNGESGLEKNEFINIYYNDSVGKRELLYELVLTACLPKEWGACQEEPKVIEEGQELTTVLIDV